MASSRASLSSIGATLGSFCWEAGVVVVAETVHLLWSRRRPDESSPVKDEQWSGSGLGLNFQLEVVSEFYYETYPVNALPVPPT